MKHRLSVLLGVICAGLTTSPVLADSVADFYKGRTISLLMGTGPGGSYDLYARVIAPHLARHIPGNPTIIIEHMPGAGGVNAGNYIFGAGPQDGSKILETHALPLMEKLRSGKQAVRYKSDKLQWLGAFDEIVQVMTVWHTAPVKTLDDLKKKEIIVGSMAKNHLTYQWASILQNNYGTAYKVITGYGSGGALNVAMEKGEIHAWTASWENLKGTRPQWLKDKTVRLFAQFTMERNPELPDIPTLIELSPPDKRAEAEFLVAGTPIARAMAVGPGVPADRVAALRKAFDDTMKDKALLADAEKRQLSIRPRGAAEVTALVNKIVSASPELVARVKASIGQTE